VLIPTKLVVLPPVIKVSVLIIFVLLFVTALKCISQKSLNLVSLSNFFNHYTGSMWFMPILSAELFLPVLNRARMILKLVDQGWIEYYGGQGAYGVLSKISVVIDLFNYSNLKYYVFSSFLVFIVVFIIIYYLNSLTKALL